MDSQIELQLLAAVEELKRSFAMLEQRQDEILARLPPALGEKGAQLEALLAAIHGQIGEDPWPVSWLADDDHLVGAVCAIVGKHKPGSRGERIGIFLSRHVGVHGKWSLELARTATRSGNLYCVRVVTIPSQPSHGIGRKVF